MMKKKVKVRKEDDRAIVVVVGKVGPYTTLH